ncbi:phospholipid-translocating P-type ATPase [Vararia minispora EC-137]|uniref:Phospholipid-translocating P-type ATPase n=1 Tax=Vararia minispora EC-137 TaxID=1314806 RepID=A0ACB8QRN4_9AGAM|nr:phospholipid-translocating P-type ATPase [Vararia minispora EC-137]
MSADDAPPRSGFRAFWHRLNNFSIGDIFESRKPPGPPRTIFVNEPLPPDYHDPKHPDRVKKEHRYYANQVITSKYTIFTFVPRNLLEQFRRVANIYFLVIAILQFNNRFATISPGLVILPLIIVIAITALKDAYEDFKRHQSDRRVNYSEVRILAGGAFHNYNATAPKALTFVRALPFRPKVFTRSGKRKNEVEMLMNAAPPEAVRSQDQPAIARHPTMPDIQRRQSRRSGLFTRHHNGEPHWETTIWEDLKVGDIVMLTDHESVPADILICATSEDENIAFVETKNLDGETNLKSRSAVPALTHLRTPEDCADPENAFEIEADRPEPLMHRLNAAVVYKGERSAVDTNQVLLRGTVLRNTQWVIGVVMYTGYDTKLVLNAGGTPSKRSRVERQMDPMVAANLALLALMATVCAIADAVLEHRYYPRNAPWLFRDNQSDNNPSINGIITWAFALITFQNIVPISLYISIEFVRTAQAAFIYLDREIYYEKTDTATLARSFVLSDDLGQVEYVFSDKTGTLTQNAMVFRRASVGGIVYVGDEVEEEEAETPRSIKDPEGAPSTASTSATPTSVPRPVDAVGIKLSGGVLQRFRSDALRNEFDAVAASPNSPDRQRLEMFWTVLALCHTVLAGVDRTTHQIEYKAQSPDEAALVQAAADIGFEFRGRDKDVLFLRTPFAHEAHQFRLLNILEFTSARKRMSVLLRALGPDGREEGPIMIFTKGADNVIFERLRPGDDALKRTTEVHLDEFASLGLRTLTLAYRIVPEDEYAAWLKDYQEATATLDDRESRVEAVSSVIEHDFTLLGATAIEDRLQDGVPETIADLKTAGIKVWVLTGDKLETAIAIGYSTNLIGTDSNIIVIRGRPADEAGEGAASIYAQMLRAAEEYFPQAGILKDPAVDGGLLGRASGRRMSRRFSNDVRSIVGNDNGSRAGGYVLVIDGRALEDALADEKHKHLLLRLGVLCQAVVCCRVSPKQKALVVRLVKDGIKGTMTLAIGDGANDVSMIQAADVGVGISGEEGLQAVNSSDYAIAQFRFLKRLLFVHGHWSYYRNGNMITNFFYKNIICIGVLWWFQIYCGWSSAYAFEYSYLLFWNSFWTIAPVIAIGIFDRLIDDRVLMKIPELYRFGREQHWFGNKLFAVFMFDGIVQSAIVFFLIIYPYATTTARSDGFEVFQFETGTALVFGAAFAANLFGGLNTQAWTWWVVFAICLGPVLLWLWTIVYNVLPPSQFYNQVYGDNRILFASPVFWFAILLTAILALLPRYMYKVISFTYTPNDIDILRWYTKANPRLHDGSSRRTSGGVPKRPSTTIGVNAAAMGSQIDMATGMRSQSRGYGFAAEEGGVEIRRIQSHLSGTSEAQRKRGGRTGSLLRSIRRPLTLTRTARRKAPKRVEEVLDDADERDQDER